MYQNRARAVEHVVEAIVVPDELRASGMSVQILVRGDEPDLLEGAWP
jgi:hypothetical protein